MNYAFRGNALVQWISIASLVAGSVTACGGDDDDDDDGGSGGTAGSTGKAGSASKGGAAGKAGSAGSAGSAGQTGSTGRGGSGSAGLAGSGNESSAGEGGAAGEGDGASGATGEGATSGESGAAGASASGGTSGAGGESGSGDGLLTSTPQQLSDESETDYADNLHGILTGGTLSHWIDDWSQNKPAAATGKLVVLQISPSVASSLLRVAENDDVASYLVPGSELTQVRDNGLSQIEAEIPDGAAADAFLKKYGIDVKKDYVALSFEQLAGTQNAIVQSVGRAWLLLRYWGFPKERLGILNGSVNWNATHQGLVTTTDPATTPPNDGTSSVRDLRVDNTAYVVTLSGLLAILKQESGATPLADVSIVDARGGAEALGLPRATSTGKNDCTNYATPTVAPRRSRGA